ncbi:peptidoglycan DD-metalloendopeptidase family protein [Streptomyces sp. NPDC057426]|uniref:M23 family metallopeptidase n=1 Tax=Streptomyces sp. NPDC057426 TaxID=3346128 RepID=UPI0036762062
MNDQHPHAGYVGDDAHSAGGFATDPLFGALPGGYDAGHSGQYDTTQWSGSHQWESGAYGTTGQYDTTGQYATTGQYDTTGQHDTGGQYDTTGQWDASAWNEAQQTGQYESAHFASYDTTGQWTTPAFETGTYDATAWNYATAQQDVLVADPVVPQQYTPEYDFVPAPEAQAEQPDAYEAPYEAPHEDTYQQAYEETYEQPHEAPSYEQPHEAPSYEESPYEESPYEESPYEESPYEESREGDYTYEYDYEAAAESEDPATEFPEESPAAPEPAPAVAAATVGRPVRRSSGGSRGRRRTPTKRSALLTVAVPSACVMGVAGIAAASVGGLADPGADTKDDTTALAAADPASVKPVAANNELDTQLAALSADARDFGDRASRTQERIDLKARQEAEKKKREEEAARKEAMRPKFALPVKLHQLSASYGQAGVNWMSVHTGIDFPVQYGTKVMAATDGTVRTQWNSAYGNMAIVTAPDGTETWYCHLSSTKIRSGKVKAGDVIAYSGNSGNSTGPHLHFEVRPGGGAAIDPEAWLRSHGLSPTG